MRNSYRIDWKTVRKKAEMQLISGLYRAVILAYGCAAVLLITYLGDFMFYLDGSNDTSHFYRFLWCYSIALLGGGIRLWLQYNGYGSIVEYLLYYPCLLAAIAALVFALVQASAPRGYLFYYVTGSLCFIFGVMVDSFLNNVSHVLSALGKLCSKF